MENNKFLPTFGRSFGNGWEAMGNNFLELFLVIIVLGIIDIPASMLQYRVDPTHFQPFLHHEFKFFHVAQAAFATLGVIAVFLGIIALAYSILILPVFKFGAKLMFVHAARGIRPEFDTLVKGFKQNYFYIVLANLLTIALVMMGFIALIIPGIIVLCRLSFVSYLVMDKNMDPIMAVEQSWKMTRGHGWTIFFMGIVSFFIMILGFLLLIVGIFPALIWVKSSFASLYQAVLVEKNMQEEIKE